MKNTDYSLYCIIDLDYLKGKKKNFKKAVVSVLRAGATALQLRSKHACDKEFYEAAVYIKKTAGRYKVPLIINDRIDTAYCVDADGVHIGADDMPLNEARKILGKGVIIGLSAQNEKEALFACRQRADYIGVGPVFRTSIKAAKPIGIERLKKIVKKSKKTVVAIGGIKEKNISLLKKAGVRNFAIISDILSSKNIYKKTKRISDIINKRG